MARPTILTNPKRINLLIEDELHQAAKKRVRKEKLGSFGEYVARLLVADMKKPRSSARFHARTLPDRN